MKIMVLIRVNFILFLTLTCGFVSGQVDTTIYFTRSLKVTDNKSGAVSYSRVVKQDKDLFTMMDYNLQDKRWIPTNYISIRKENSKVFRLTSKSQNDKSKNIVIRRFFFKTDIGYSIKDYNDTILIQEGESKLIFPLIKFGAWRFYDSSTGKIKTEETFMDNESKSSRYYINDNEDIDEPFVLVEKMPKYKGGDAALLRDIAKHTNYPEEARQKNITGTVFVRFVIMNDGSVKGAQLLKKVHPLLDSAAIKAVLSLPDKWSPGEQSGKKVNIFYMVPVVFLNSVTNNP